MKKFLSLLIFASIVSSVSAQNYQLIKQDEEEAARLAALNSSIAPEDAVITSSSIVDWNKKTFNSTIDLNINKANIPMPSGKSSAVKKIQMELPVLIKDPLLSLYVDDTQTLNDLVVEGTLTLEDITHLIENSRYTPPFFASDGINLRTSHSITIQDLGSIMVRHRVPYEIEEPLEHISTRGYSGIIIDARGNLPIHGEFSSAPVDPCLFPKIYDTQMNILYEKAMVDPERARNMGIVFYSSSDDIKKYEKQIGKDPLWITAKEVFGVNRCDPVVSHEDYLKIAGNQQNRKLLEDGKVVILLDENVLKRKVSAPEKNKKYYLAYQQIKKFIVENKVPDTILIDGPTGIQLLMQNLKFIADSPELLPEERPRIETIANSLKKILANSDFSILVEGHTADVNKPNGQLILSIQRAQAIIDALSQEGIDRSIFTYKGYGGTLPVADNDTPEGRAQNRRVVITVMPKSSYIQRRK